MRCCEAHCTALSRAVVSLAAVETNGAHACVCVCVCVYTVQELKLVLLS